MKQVSICGIPYKIIEVAQEFEAGSEVHFGEILYAKSIIKINKDLVPQMKKQTLLHEYLHGVFINIGRNDLAQDEVFIQTMANAMYRDLTLNVEEITEGDNND